MNTTNQQPPSKIQQFNSVAGTTDNKSSHNYNYYQNELSTIGMRIRYNLDQRQSQSRYQGMETDNSYSIRSYAGVIIPQYRQTVTLNVEPPMLGNQRSVSGSSASSFQLFNDSGKSRRGEDDEDNGGEEEYVYSNGKRRLY